MKTLKHLIKPIGMTMIAGTLISGPFMDIGTASLSQELARTNYQPVARTQACPNYVLINMTGGHQAKVCYTQERESTTVIDFSSADPQPVDSGVTRTRIALSCDFGCNRDSFSALYPEARAYTPQELSDLVKNHLLSSDNKQTLGTLFTARKNYESKLEKAKKDAEDCKITYKDYPERNTVEIESLSGTDNRQDRLDCKVGRFNDGDYETDREERLAFDSIFSDEISDIVRDGDREGLYDLFNQFDGRSPFMRSVFSEANKMASVGSQVSRYEGMLSDTNLDPTQRQLLEGELDILKQQTNMRWGNIPNQAGLNSLVQSKNSLLESIQLLRDSVYSDLDLSTSSFQRGTRATSRNIPRIGGQTVGGQRLGGDRLGGQRLGGVPQPGQMPGQMPNSMPPQNGGRPY